MENVNAKDVRSRMQHANALAKQLSAAGTPDRIDVMNRIVARITVHENSIQIFVRTDAICSFKAPTTDDAPTTMIEVPVKLKRCGLAVRLIVKAPGASPERNPDPRMVALISKGLDWFERLTSGRYDSLNAIAQQEKVDSSYVTRLIYLAFLDPDIVQRILKGDHPEELTAKRLMQMVPFPSAWSEQGAVLGMHD